MIRLAVAVVAAITAVSLAAIVYGAITDQTNLIIAGGIPLLAMLPAALAKD